MPPHVDSGSETETAAYHYPDQKRIKIPTSAETAQAKIREVPPARLQYDPHLSPVLRSDANARAEVLLEAAAHRALTSSEINELAALVAHHQPWLEWAGKREAGSYADVAPPPLHIHEFIASEAIIRVAKRQDVPRNLFSDFEAEDRAGPKSYLHETDWKNRLILGDSLQVMASLSSRENLAGKVQTIYFDPPYGIKYASNFQSEVGKRDVKDRDDDLTREAEVAKAYRDTWTLGIRKAARPTAS